MLFVKSKLKLLVEVCQIVYRYDKFLVVYLIHNTKLQFNFDTTNLILLGEIVYNFLNTLEKQVKCSNKINMMLFHLIMYLLPWTCWKSNIHFDISNTQVEFIF